MSAAEVPSFLSVAPIVVVLVSAFHDGVTLGNEARHRWWKYQGRDNSSTSSSSDQTFDKSLATYAQRIRQAYTVKVERYGSRFSMGDGKSLVIRIT